MTQATRLLLRAAAIALLVTAVDQALKAFVRQHLAVCHALLVRGCPRLELAGPLGLVRAENAGSAFGFYQGLGLWVLVGALALLLIPLYGRRLRPGHLGAALAVGLQAGGALGNLLDRLLYG